MTQLTPLTWANPDDPDWQKPVFGSSVVITPRTNGGCEVVDVDLQWGSDDGPELLPILTMPVPPVEGQEILLAYETRDEGPMFFGPPKQQRHAVRVEKIVVDAEDPSVVSYLAYVVPA